MIRDLLWALRWLRNNPLFTASVTVILALGIGANTAVFSIVDAVLLRPLPYESSNRLVRIEETSTKVVLNGIPPEDYLRWSERSDLFEKTAAFLRDFLTLTGAGEPDQVIVSRTSAVLFSMLGVHARLGRPLVESDSANVVVLSDRSWRRRFRADPGALGRLITLGDEGYTIVGVMAPEFEFPSSEIEMWIPLRVTPAFANRLQAVARMKTGVSLPQVQSAMGIVAHQLEQEHAQSRAGLQITVSPWRETPTRQYELTMVFILVAVGLILLIACADVGSLLLSRAVQRQREIAIRASLGAGFWRVMQQLLAESLVLAVLGSAAGIAAAHYLLQFLSKQLTALPIAIPHIQRVSLNGRVLLFNAVLCVLLACLFSLAPVFLAAKMDLQRALRGGNASRGGPKGPARIFSILIASEAAFAFLLLVGSGLMIRSLVRLEQADHGFHPQHVLTMRVPIGTRTQLRPSGKYDTKQRQMAYYREIVDRLQRIPGVRDAAVVNNLPLSGANTSTPLPWNGEEVLLVSRTISPRYFSAMGIPLIAGRVFRDADQTGAPPVAIVNEYLAQQLFPNRNPLGQTMPASDRTVVGVVRNASQAAYDQPAKGELYLPYQQIMFGIFLSTIVVRTSGEPLSLASALRKEVWAVDANQPIMKVETMDDVIADSIWRPRFSAWIFSVLGGLALLLTSAGVYSVVAYTTALRAREMGIRVALGATPRKVVALVLRSAMTPLTIGFAISLVAALLLSRLLVSLLYEIAGTDPMTYLGAGVLLLAIGAVATFRPAWKAAGVDPVKALRTE